MKSDHTELYSISTPVGIKTTTTNKTNFLSSLNS